MVLYSAFYMAQKYFLLKKYMHMYIRRDGGRKIFVGYVMQMFYGRIPMRVNRNQREPLKPKKHFLYDGFQTYQYNSPDLRTWRMDVSERNPNKKDPLMFARENKEKCTDLAEQEVQRVRSAKVYFALEVMFSRERDGQRQKIRHFFHYKNNQPHLFMRPAG